MKNTYDIIIIGAGPSGMLAATKLAEQGSKVLLIEQNERLGKKLFITGKGRCNVTNDSDVENHINNMTCNQKFMYSSLYSFDSYMLQEHFQSNGLKLKVERGNRVFPESNRSNDVIRTLAHTMKKNKVEIKLNTKVTEVNYFDDMFSVYTEKIKFTSKKLIIATGGKSYQQTGSTGDGYIFAKAFGHTVTKCVCGLVPLETEDEDIKEISGLSLRNVKSTFFNDKNKEVYYEMMGELMFTHHGVTGPLVLTASSYIPRDIDYKDIFMYIDLKPALDDEKLDKRLLRDFEKYNRKALKNSLNDLLPGSLIPLIIKRSNLDENMPVHKLTKETRQQLLENIKRFKVNIKGTRGFNEAIITRGGISTKEINPHTMESLKQKGLYFIGEVIDIDSLTGGYNLQLAFSSANLCASSIEK